jgi:Methyltransferase domain
MLDTVIAQPGVMPLDREAWKNELNLSNFTNTYYQFRDLHGHVAPGGKVLIIGPGIGLDALILRWRGYSVTTFDIDETFGPDVLGSCHDMPMFADGQFDAVIASHVLEHLPVPYLDRALKELARVAGYAIIYLPVAGKHAQLRLKPSILGRNLDFVIDLFKFWETPSGVDLKYTVGQHYWEVGYRGFTIKLLKARLSNYFSIVYAYRNMDWIPSMNFVLKSHGR